MRRRATSLTAFPLATSVTQPATSVPSPRFLTPRPGIAPVIGLTVLAVLVYAAILALSDVKTLGNQIEGFPPWIFGVALVMVAVGYGFRTLRWHLYLSHLGHRVRSSSSILTFLSGFALGVTPGKLGEVVKAYYLAERARVPYAVSMAAVVAERTLDVVAVALLLGLALLTLPSIGSALGLLLIPLVLVGLVVLRSPRTLAVGTWTLLRVPFLRRTLPHLEAFHVRLRPLLGGAPLLYGMTLGLAAWALEPIAMWLLARGLGIELSLAACAFVFAAASLGGVLTMIPGGLGATEGGMVVLLTFLGVPLAEAASLTLAIRLATLWFGVLVGGIAIALLRLGARRPPADAERPVPHGG